MSDRELETALKAQALELELGSLHKEINELRNEVNKLKEERNSLMKWGLMTLGAAVVGLVLYVWNLLTSGALK